MKKFPAILCFASLFLLLGAQGKERDSPTAFSVGDIPFPADYRTTFTNYLSLDRTQNPDQIIRLFANDTALEGPGADGKLPHGSVLVAEVYKARKNAAGEVMTSSLGRRIRSDLALIAVMQREEGWGLSYPPELSNENWEFATFKPDGSTAPKNLDTCRQCHAPLVKTHHLFSLEHLTNP